MDRSSPVGRAGSHDLQTHAPDDLYRLGQPLQQVHQRYHLVPLQFQAVLLAVAPATAVGGEEDLQRRGDSCDTSVVEFRMGDQS